LVQVMENGRRLQAPEPLVIPRERIRAQLAALSSALRELRPAPPYEVEIAPELRALTARLDES
jgi:hypothetical protein